MATAHDVLVYHLKIWVYPSQLHNLTQNPESINLKRSDWNELLYYIPFVDRDNRATVDEVFLSMDSNNWGIFGWYIILYHTVFIQCLSCNTLRGVKDVKITNKGAPAGGGGDPPETEKNCCRKMVLFPRVI